MGTQQSSRSQARLKQASEKQTNTELDFIFKRPIFWRPSYIAQSAWLEHIPCNLVRLLNWAPITAAPIFLSARP